MRFASLPDPHLESLHLNWLLKFILHSYEVLILITVLAALLVSYYTLLKYLGTIQVSCDFGNKFGSVFIAITPGFKYLISVSMFF